MRLALIGFNFAQPFLITTAVRYIQEPVNKANNNVGYGLMGATILIYLGISASISRFHPREDCFSKPCFADTAQDLKLAIQLQTLQVHYSHPRFSRRHHIRDDPQHAVDSIEEFCGINADEQRR